MNNEMNEARIYRMVYQVWGYVSADIPSDWSMADCMDLLLGTDYFTLHAKDKEAIPAFYALPRKKQKSIVRQAVA